MSVEFVRTSNPIHIINEKAVMAVDKVITQVYVFATADGNVPVDTGITQGTTTKEINGKMGQVAITTPYAKFTYFGTEKMLAGGLTGIPQWLGKGAEGKDKVLIEMMEL